MSVESVQAALREKDATPLRALCIARHCFLSEHIARYFARMGVITAEAVGLDAAVEAARRASPNVIICDYDLLATIPLEKWERDELLSNTPVIAVSLTRHSQELHLLDVNGIAGFLYLPTLETVPALKILHAAASRPKYTLPQPVNIAPRTLERG
jgi:DNA-binding NarL/FixJ family response regulator